MCRSVLCAVCWFSLASVQRDIAKDYIRRLCAQLAHLANSILDWTEMLQAVLARTSLGFDESVQRQYADLVFMNTQTLPTLFRWIGEAKDRVQAELKEPELDQIDQLRSAIQNLMHALTPALPEIGEFLTSSGRFGAKDSVQQRVQARLSSLTTACEGLQACLLAIKPDGQGDMGLQAVVETVKTMGSGPRGIEKLAFHMMRHQITELYGGELVTIRGHDGNVIDGCYVPCTSTRRYMMAQRNAVPSTTAPAATQSELWRLFFACVSRNDGWILTARFLVIGRLHRCAKERRNGVVLQPKRRILGVQRPGFGNLDVAGLLRGRRLRRVHVQLSWLQRERRRSESNAAQG